MNAENQPAKRGRKPKQAVIIDDACADGPNEPVMPVRASRGSIPLLPESDPTLGMKTPAVVAWWFEFHPAEAAVKYAGLTLPQLED